MANNQYINKVIYGGDILIDLTTDSVSAGDVLSGKTFHLPSGEQKTGTCAYDADTSDATANAAEILISKTAYKNGSKVTGTMPNRESVVGTITTKEQEYTVPQGYHDGGGKVSIDSTEQGKLTPTNIRSGVTILGVEGSMTGTEDVNAQTTTVTPSTSSQVITPTTPTYNYLAQVTVNAIPFSESDNAAGGKTVTIAGASA